MNSKSVFWLLIAVLLITFSLAQAQQPAKIPRIGYLAATKATAIAARTDAFRQGLSELGYIDGKNIIVEYRYADGNPAREGELAAELVRQKVEIIVTTGPTVTRTVKHATATIPIIFAQDGDPVASGFVASLARPGGNITGLSNLSPELSGKRLELLKEIVPKLSRVAAIGGSNEPNNAQILKELGLAAASMKLRLQTLDVRGPADIAPAFQAAAKERADGAVFLGSVVFGAHRKQIVELAVKHRLPATYTRPEFVEDGGLMTYGPNINDLFRRTATYVDKILKGAKPAELPVQQPLKFEFIVNLQAAKQIGLTIPQSVLYRTDKVIK
jgi:putative ABC transport system substrate-binding protein